MKKLALGLLSVGVIVTGVLAGPADKAATVIKKTKIENKSELQGSKITNVGIDQKNTIGSIKIRKGVKIEKSKISNKSKIQGTKVTNVGIGQDNTIGSIDIGDTATPKATSGYIRYQEGR